MTHRNYGKCGLALLRWIQVKIRKKVTVRVNKN